LNGLSSARRAWLKLFLRFVVFCVLALSLLGWYITTDSFQQRIRRKVIATLEDATGGRVEIGQIHTVPLQFRIDIRNLTIHGREAPDQLPYLHVDRAQVEAKIISVFSREVGLHSLMLDRPVAHIVVNPDGSTNQPTPVVQNASSQTPIARLFSLSVSKLGVRSGELVWASQKVPLEFDARDVSLSLNYSFFRRQYQAAISVGSAPTRYQDYPPFTWHAKASLALARDHADIEKLDAGLEKSEIHFSGQVLSFQHPELSGAYSGSMDLPELAALTEASLRKGKPARGRFVVRSGSATLAGKGTWSLQDFSTEGAVEIKDLDVSDKTLDVRSARASSDFTITPLRLRLSSLKAAVLGGELQGDVDVTNWQTSLEPSLSARKRPLIGRISPGSLQRGAIHVRVSNFPIGPALQEVSSKRLRIDGVRLAANAIGAVEMLWVGSIGDAETKLDLVFKARGRSLPGELASSGEMRGIYRGSRDELALDRFHLITPASEVTAQGELSSTSLLRISFSSRNLNEWQALLHTAWGPEPLPFAVNGPVNFNGAASGRLSDFALSGSLRVEDFQTTLAMGAQHTQQTIAWDSLSATLQYSPAALSLRNATLIHGAGVMHFEGSTSLVGGVVTRNSPFNLRFDIRNGDLAELVRLAGYSYPVSGTFHVSAHASGTAEEPHGEGHVEISNAVVYGDHAGLVRSDLRLSQRELQFNNVEASFSGAPVTGSAVLSTVDNTFRLNLSASNLDLAGFPPLHTPRFTVDGRADTVVHVAGTVDQPLLEAHIHFRDLAFDKERVGDFFLDIVPQGVELEIQGHSAFDTATGKNSTIAAEAPSLDIKGTVHRTPGWLADLDISFRHLDVDSLLRIYLHEHITNHATVGGTLRLSGPLRSPRELKLAARLDSLDAELERVPVRAAEPIQFEILNQQLRVENFHLTGTETDFSAHGTAMLTQAGQVDLQGQGTVNMALLQTLNPNLTAHGMVMVNLTAGGTLTEPLLQGKLELKDASLSHNDFPSGLSELNGVVVFDQNRFSIESMSGKSGGGVVTLSGSAIYSKGTFNMDFSAQGREVRLRYPPGVSSTANANLRLTGSTNSALVSGNILITKLAVTPGFDFAAYLEKAKLSGSVVHTETIASHVRLDVHVTTTPELQMQTAVAKLSGTADLQLRGTVDRPAVLGRAEVLEGEIVFNGTRYRVERGEVTFANPAKTEPSVDLRLTTRVRDYDITVGINGDASKPNGLTAKWQSEPPLPEADVIALLALGRTTEESAALQSGGNSSFGGEASNLLINQALNSTVNSRLQRLFGVSRIKVDPQGLANATNLVRGPQVTLEQQVASKLTITYSANVSIASQQIIQLEYNVTRNISVIALRDQNGVVSFDIRIRSRKK